MTAVRPPIFPPSRPAPSGPQRADPAKLAAQRAFFEAALGKTQASAPAAPPAPSAQTTQPTPQPTVQARPHATSATSADTPGKILRPGSLVDIRV